MSFSIRQGFKENKLCQLNSIDNDLLHAIWNQVEGLFEEVNSPDFSHARWRIDLDKILKDLWRDFFKQPIHLLRNHPYSWSKRDLIRDKYYNLPWYEVYSFLEHIVNLLSSVDHLKEEFIKNCNCVLERENSGYRFIDDLLTPITSKIEIKSIEESLSEDDEASKHIEEALIMIANKEYDQLRSCISRARLGVEAMAKKVTGDKNATLSSLCQRSKIIPNHPQAREALHNLYNYASDKEGIRHSLTDESSPVFLAWARFVLVNCSSFINLIKSEKMETVHI